MMSTAEKSVLKTFRTFQMQPGEMLCFNGLDLDTKSPALDLLVGKKFLTREKFKGAFSLTQTGYFQMRNTA